MVVSKSDAGALEVELYDEDERGTGEMRTVVVPSDVGRSLGSVRTAQQRMPMILRPVPGSKEFPTART